MLNYHTLNLYLIIATGAILPIAADGIMFPLHTAYIAIYLALLLQFSDNRTALLRGILVLLPIFLAMMIGLTRANDVPYALEKIEGGVLAALLAAVITFHCVRRYGEYDFLESYLNVTLVILAATIIYRTALGYELGSRDGRFLINGPITYGWLMGIGATVALFLYQQSAKKKNLVYLAAFIAMSFVTGSKGPIVAMVFSFTVFVIYFFRSKRVLMLAFSAALGVVGASQYLTIETLGRFAALYRLFFGQVEEQDSGSIGIRSIAWSESMSIFDSHTFWGVGLGNWENYSSIKIIYPHNFFLEIASELGIIGLTLFTLTISLLFLSRTFFVVLYLLFFLIALSFSGDMSYYRYLLGIPLGLYLEKKSRVGREVAC